MAAIENFGGQLRFLRQLNEEIYRRHPDVKPTQESTSLAVRVTSDLCRQAWVRDEVGYGLDARYAGIRGWIRSIVNTTITKPNLPDALRVPGKFLAPFPHDEV